MSSFQSAKSFLVDHTHLAQDALHVYVGLGVFLGSCLLFRWKVVDWKAWLLVLLAALAGEGWDYRDSVLQNNPHDRGEAIKDLVNTVLVPSALLVLARFTTVFERRSRSGDKAQVANPAPGAQGNIAEPGN
ncbi:MAG: hypothetical protein B7X57_03930 [Erythrobacter sp. 34-65-8]|nr:MAG: hypothetical protein B7X57_03930 [Erythrobacter sp. 34-65-8]